MKPLRNPYHALALLIVIGLFVRVSANASDENLLDAIRANDLFRTKSLLAAKADVNAKTTDGITALMLASQNGRSEVVRALLAAKAVVNAKTAAGDTALILASICWFDSDQEQHSKVVPTIMLSGLPLKSRGFRTLQR
jgi:ankyrin repeat protein